MNQEWKVQNFEWGSFALDGGAMFGVVPKTLWSQLIIPDECNRIPLSLKSLYLEKGESKVLVDLGMGFDWDEKYKKIYKLETSPVEVLLKNKLNIKATEITHIVLTHLHFDHCGFLAQKKGNEWESTFPNAEIFLLEENYKNAMNPNVREAASYLPHLWAKAYKDKQFSLIPCEWLEHREILPGLFYRRVDGHTRGQGMLYIDGIQEKSLFLGDLCPTRHHTKEAYVMGYDLNPGLSVIEKRQIFSEPTATDLMII